MDGARFANGLAATGMTPAEMTWKRGVDILSFGATKNGCWCAEAVVFFDPAKASQFPYIRKRGAQLFSKTRFVAAQFMAYLENDLWLELGSHANRMADRLRAGLDASNQARQAWPTHTNESFAILKADRAEALKRPAARSSTTGTRRTASTTSSATTSISSASSPAGRPPPTRSTASANSWPDPAPIGRPSGPDRRPSGRRSAHVSRRSAAVSGPRSPLRSASPDRRRSATLSQAGLRRPSGRFDSPTGRPSTGP